MRKLLAIAIIASTGNLLAQQPTMSADTSSWFFQPQLAISISPLALADYNGGHGIRMGTEYTIRNEWTGMTEFTYYLPFHTMFKDVQGFRIRQDFRKYNAASKWFMGFSMMMKKQSLDYIAVIPINDTTSYQKQYTLNKIVVVPAYAFGANARGEKWYVEVVVYGGLRFKNADVEGLTPHEKAVMWNYDTSGFDNWQLEIALKQGMHLGLECNASLRIGYILK